MKKLLLIILLFVSHFCFSQSQDLKQLQLNIQKLAQLKAMLSEMYRGYAVLDRGYSSIKNLSQGNFDLHKTHLDQLLQVSPTVKNNPKIAAIVNIQSQIVYSCKASIQLVTQSTQMSELEKNNITSLLQSISSRSYTLIDELQLVSKTGVLRMNDAERMQAIDRIETVMKEKLSLVQQQAKNITILCALRKQQSNETEKLKSLF